ncbi:MAG: PBP1A family penicillin-binding protein [Anaerovoracaceae bacterium]|nr:PBP1A family penicillin-binding protein [Bacillota bacterium]MDY2670389.1 PBP1A family penicillin-binding protein [Anaerovoracaceae bacterium]
MDNLIDNEFLPNDGPMPEGHDQPPENGKKKKKKKKKKHRVLKVVLIVILAIILAGAAYVGYVILTAPTINPKNIYSLLNTTSMLYDDKGDELEAVSTADSRTLAKYNEIPDNMKNAFIAIEDKTFYKHKGFNVVRIIGAVKNSIVSGGRVGGTSTITQQLARNLYLSSERSINRKIKEAYYTVILEHDLSKKQILEAYLNTIYLGYNSSGVQAASKAYFGADMKDLSVAQCAVLASIPKSPNSNAPIKKMEKGSLDSSDPNIISESSDGTYVNVYNDGFRSRQKLVLKNMLDQGYITKSEYNQALNEDIKSELNPTEPLKSTVATYFADYCLDEVVNDLMKQYKMDEASARDTVYNKGLKIYSTIDVDMQETAEEQFQRNGNFPGVTNLHRDSSRNIVGTGANRHTVILYYKSNYFNKDGAFVLGKDEFKLDGSGNLVILKGHRLNIYKTSSGKPQIELKNMYEMQNGRMYTIKGGYFNGLDPESLSFDSEGNAVVAKSFLSAHPNFFQIADSSVTIAQDNFTLSQETIQPQGAMVITDYKTGQIKVMVGGRGDVKGKMVYNRANNPRQPGSSIKPIAVYGPAIESGVDKGTRYTAGTTVKDSPTSNGWPTNWYNGYRGYVTLRTAVEQSSNVVAVKIVNDIGYDYSAEMLKKNGVTTVVETGDNTDLNPAALGLGGMIKGISPMQMASAYGTFGNGGVHITPTTYTKVEDSQGNVILQKEPEKTQVYDEGVAWIMTNILRTTVERGIAGDAAIGIQPVAGKTGTTSDNFDAWFCGLTPQYSAALWIGNDYNIELTRGSGAAASLWARIMRRVCDSSGYDSFGKRPSDVIMRGGEYYVKGTRAHGQAAEWRSGDPDKKEEQKKQTSSTSTTQKRTQSSQSTQNQQSQQSTQTQQGQQSTQNQQGSGSGTSNGSGSGTTHTTTPSQGNGSGTTHTTTPSQGSGNGSGSGQTGVVTDPGQ